MRTALISSILAFLVYPVAALATVQRPDLLEYEGQFYEFCHYDSPRILDDYFKQQGIPKPKELESKGSALWRGYVGIWRIVDGKLWLTALFPYDTFVNDAFPLGKIFKDAGPAVLADWFTGKIDFRKTELRREKKLTSGSKDKYFDVIYYTVEYLVIEKGKVIRIDKKEESR